MGVGRGGGRKSMSFRFRFSDVRFPVLFFLKICSENMLVRYRGINNTGVLERPGTKMEGFEGHFSYIEIPIFQKSGLSDAM